MEPKRKLSRYERKEEQRVKSLYEGDALKYFELCNECGIPLEQIERQGLYNIGETEAEKRKKISELEMKAAISAKTSHSIMIDGKRAIKFNYERFGCLIKKSRRNYGHVSLSKNADIGIKVGILKNCGYSYLTIAPGLVVKIEDAKHDRISAVYANQYNQWMKRNQQKEKDN